MAGEPSPRALAAYLAAVAVPFVALAVWFGAIDTTGIGESRPAIEGWVTAVHLAAGGVLAALVAWASAARRRLEGSRADTLLPARPTRVALGAVALYVVAALVWEDLFGPYGFVALFASLAAAPLAVAWWIAAAVTLARTPPRTAEEAHRLLGRLLWLAWGCLLVLLPGLYAWVWVSRVQWLVF